MKKFFFLIIFFLLINFLIFNKISLADDTQKKPNLKPGTPNLKPGTVEIHWVTKTAIVCPPSIFGYNACNYPSYITLIIKIKDLLINSAPYVLVGLITIGGLMYLLTPFGVENYIKKGHKYIKYAIIGYILMLLVTTIFSIIKGVIGGP